MALTDAGIKALKPRAARYIVSDGRGLSLDILPSGKMSWLYRYRLEGKYGKVNLGRYPDLSLKAARGKRDELAGLVAIGKNPALEAQKRRAGGLTFDMDPLTIHDLRRTGATLLTEHGFNRDVIEKALSHEAAGIRAVYIVAEYAEQRKRMLQWWGDYVDGIVNESKVIVGNFGATA
jgi:integrase